MKPLSGRRLLIMDACVLIDYIKARRTVLPLIREAVGLIHVITPIVEEVKELEDEEELVALGLIIIEPELEDAFTAVDQNGSTSFQDNLCLLTAKRHGFTCITNDKSLRRLCEAKEVPILWGLELLYELHQAGGITVKDAVQVAHAIRKSNPMHITEEIVERFINKLRRFSS